MRQTPLPLHNIAVATERHHCARAARAADIADTDQGEALLPLVDSRQACELLGIKRSKLWAEMQAGRLGFVKLGALTRFTPQHLDDYVRLLLDETAQRWPHHGATLG